MARTWKSEPQGEVECENCRSVYEKTMHRFPMRDSDSFNCEVCGHVMDSWNSTHAPSYKLKTRREPPKR